MVDEYNEANQKRLEEEAAAKRRSLLKIGLGVATFLMTGQLPPDTPIGVQLDVIHGGLDILGMVPVVGEPADGVNCGIYAIEGIIEYFHPFGRDGAWMDAGLACASMVPLAGWATTPAKWVRYSEKYGPEAKKVFDELKGIFKKAPNCAGKNSFPAGTRVLMGDSSSRPIEQIRPGDLVLATDPATDVTGQRRVEATIYTPDDRDFTDITLDDRHGGGSVTATDNHPFWSETSSKWTNAADLNAGETLRTSHGDTALISEVRHWKTLQPAYNLTVNDLHTFYVLVGTTPVLTHNDDCAKLFQPKPGYDGWQHVLERHIEGSPLSSGKTVFHVYGDGRYEMADLDEIADLISETVANTKGMPNTGFNPDGTPRDGLVYQEDFGYQIGKDASGGTLEIIEVVVNPDGTLRTAYPIPRSQYRR
jgi:hypothetical protein